MTLFDPPTFDGATFDKSRDQSRLSGQLAIVQSVMADGKWHTLHEIEDRTGVNAASSSARIRDLRKTKFGAHDVERRRVSGGLFEYRISPSPAGAI